MQERNTYKNVPIAIVKRFVLNKVEEMDDLQLSRVYEIYYRQYLPSKDERKLC